MSKARELAELSRTVSDSADATAITINSDEEVTFASGVTVTGALSATGTSVFASLDISGDIDVAGTTNLDVVDIDGAVDMASTLGVTGVATLASLVATTADINAGTIDGTVIGGSTAAAGTFTTFTSTGIDDNATSTAITIDSNETVDITTGVLSTNGAFYYGSPTVAQVSANRNSTTGAIPNASNSSAYLNLNTPAGSSSMEFVLGDAVNTQPSLKMIITGAGNVGIGTSLPGAKLDVQGNVFIGTTTVSGMGPQTGLTVVGGATVSTGDPGILTLGAHLNARSAGDPIGKIDFYSNDASGGASGVQASIRGITEGSIGESAGLTFYTGTSSSLPERMRIDASGNVGIGTSSPDYLLEVEKANGDHTSTAISVTNSQLGGYGSTLNFISTRTDTSAHVVAARLRAAGNDSWNSDASTDSNLYFATVSANTLDDRMTILHNGNVGIGTSSPAIGGGRTYDVALTIDGGVSGGTEDTGALEVGGSTSVNDRLVGSISYFNRDNSGADATTRRQVAIIEARSVTSDSNAGDDSGANLTFSTKSEGGSVAERMRIDASGNVGIGTSSPSGKLDVSVASNQRIRFDDFGSKSRISSRNDAAAILPLLIDASDLILNSGSGGNVGIGGTPTDKLTLLDSGNLALRVKSTGAANEAQVWTHNDAGAINGMFMYGSTHSTYGAIAAGEGAFYSNTNVNIMSDSPSGVIKFSTGVSGGAERMRIDASGNVAIGATGALTSTYLSKAVVYTAGGANFAIGGLSDTNDAVLSRFTSFNISNGNSGNQNSANFYGVTSIESIVVTTDSNAGDDSGGSLLFKTKPEAGVLQEVMRIDASGHAIIPAGVTLGTAVGVYAAANTLDDYEEGTWTPTLTGNSAVTYAVQDGVYTKIGNTVVAKCFLTMSAWTGTGSAVGIAGLPFNSNAANASYGGNAVTTDNLTSDLNAVICQVTPGGSNAGILTNVGRTGSHAALVGTEVQATTIVRATIIYQTA
jgi:hypothetical protein